MLLHTSRATPVALDTTLLRPCCSPAGIGASPDRKTLFVATHDTAQIVSFRLESSTGAPTQLNTLDTGLEDPAYIATDLAGKYLITPFYASGCVTTYPIDSSDGAARGSALCHIDTNKHAHGCAIDPSNTHVFIPHAGGTYPHYPEGVRGGDCIHQFTLTADGTLVHHSTAPTGILLVYRNEEPSAK